jgi:hypothetical protein
MGGASPLAPTITSNRSPPVAPPQGHVARRVRRGDRRLPDPQDLDASAVNATCARSDRGRGAGDPSSSPSRRAETRRRARSSAPAAPGWQVAVLEGADSRPPGSGSHVSPIRSTVEPLWWRTTPDGRMVMLASHPAVIFGPTTQPEDEMALRSSVGSLPILRASLITVVLVAAACTSPGASPAASPSPSGVMEEKPSPSGMMEEKPSPSGMMEASPSASGMLEASPSP